MFQITDRHQAAFNAYRRDAFTEQLAQISYDYDPADDPFCTPQHRLDGAAHVLRTAEAYGYVLQGSYYFWLNLVIEFGAQMHTDPSYRMIKMRSGVPEGTAGEAHELEAMTTLSHKVKSYVEAVHGGRSNRLYEDAGRRFITALQTPDTLLVGADSDQIFSALETLYPQKLHYHGAAHQQKIADGTLAAKALEVLGTDAPQAQFTVAGLDILFGHGFDADPFKPWIGAALAACKPRTASQTLALDPLCDMLTAWFDRDE